MAHKRPTEAQRRAEAFQQTLCHVMQSPSAMSLEAEWRAAKEYWSTRRAKPLRAAVETRGWELVATHPKGDLVPHVRAKGHHFEAEYKGQSFKSGTWGNGPGARWAYADMEQWVFKLSGLRSRKQSDLLVEWVKYGMPHRALLVLEGE